MTTPPTPIAVDPRCVLFLLDQLVKTQQQLKEAHRAMHALLLDPTYGCYSRSGLEQRWHARQPDHDTLVFFDLDGLHDANERLGYHEVDRRIAAALKVDRTTIILGRYYSGDELVLLCSAADAPGLAQRIRAQLAVHGLSATFGITPITTPDLTSAVEPAATLVQAAKARQERGGIHTTAR